MANEVDIVITGNAAGLEAAQAAAKTAVDALNQTLVEQAAAAGVVSDADALAVAAKRAVADASRAQAVAERDVVAAASELAASERALAQATQAAADRQSVASQRHDERAARAAQAAQREAAALAAVAAAADASAAQQEAAQRRLVSAQQARASADAALASAQAAVTAAAERGAAEQAAAQARVASAQAQSQAGALALSQATERVAQAQADATQAAHALAAASAAAATASDAVAQARRRESAATQELAQARRAVETQQAQGQAYLQSLREQVIAHTEGAAGLARYRAEQLGVGAAAEQYISRLHGVAQAQGAAAMTAGQLAQANRMLPMQMGDAAVSLASGMPAWMVFLQQGSQIRDAYGGVGAAVKAAGGYIAQVATNPVTLAVVALGVLAAGAWSASESQHTLATAVAMSGSAAGVTASQLTDYANAAATATGASAGAAVEAVAQITRSGAVVPEVMGVATEAALALNRAGGQAVEDTVKIFAKLGQDPLNAAIELDKSFGFLTAATYEQIKAAIDSGDKHRAAQIAQEAYAASAKAAAADIVSEMGMLQRAFLATKDGAISMWNAIAGAGASKQDKEISSLREKAELGEITGAEWDRLTALEAQKKAAADLAEQKKREQEQVQRKAAWDKTINDGLTQYLPKAEREAKLAEKVAQIKAQGAAAGASQTEISARVAQAEDAARKIEDSLKPKAAPKGAKGPAGPTVTQDYERELSELRAAHAEKNAANNTFTEFSKAEELKFWADKLNTVKAGTKEETQIRKKVADLKVSITKAEYEAEIAELKKAEAEAGKNAENRLALANKTHAAIVARFGAESQAAIQSAARIAEMQQQAENQRQQIEQIGAARADGLAIAAIEAERAAFDASVQLGLTAQDQKIAAEIAFQNRIFEIKRAALEREKSLISPDLDPVAYQQNLTKITELETAHTAQGQQLQRQKISQDLQGWKSLSDGVGNAFGQTLNGIVTGTATVGGVIDSVAQAGMGVLSQLASEWISRQIMQRVMAAETAGAQITAAAGVAGANALASNAAAPWPLGLGAPAIAAGVVAAALGFKALASAEGGWYDTGSGNPLTQLHAREMVLPAHVASPMRDMISSMPAMPAVAAALPALQRMAQPALPDYSSRSVAQSQQRGGDTYNVPISVSGGGNDGFAKILESEVIKAVKRAQSKRTLK